MKITDKTLSAWLDEGLSPKQMRAVSAAVQSDPELQARAEALRAVGEALRQGSVQVTVSAERMAADVRREIRREERPQPNRIPLWKPAVAAAFACLLLVVFLIPAMRTGGESVVQTEIESVDSGLSGVSPMVYTDYESGWTVVWLDNAELEPGI